MNSNDRQEEEIKQLMNDLVSLYIQNVFLDIQGADPITGDSLHDRWQKICERQLRYEPEWYQFKIDARRKAAEILISKAKELEF